MKSLIEIEFRNDLAAELRACRKVSKKWAMWHLRYNNALLLFFAGALEFSDIRKLVEEGEKDGWIKVDSPKTTV